ncbi:DUF11 domain-containing protein [Microbulbifer pacificus]|uniref:DUF11 domain-containing protein n=1 Tax=Microbulbifer pacificus TaxID=407164 RepID=UPI000CF47761|nr:DUF11 domain-containing protein [Microbulbifer pacificus]
MLNKKTLGFLTAFGLLVVGMVPQAFAAGTTAGDTVSNTATVSYDVDGVTQDTVDSNAAEFTVDRIIRMTLDEDDSPVSTAPAASAKVSSYTLTNTSNATLDFKLAVSNVSTAVDTNNGIDTIDGTDLLVYWDENGNGIVDTGESDTVTSLAADGIAKILVVLTVPSTATDGAVIGVLVNATAHESGGGAAVTETTGADTIDSMDTVFGELASPDSIEGNGQITVYGAYVVETATLVVSKTSSVISDPFNNTTNPKFIPGALVEYCIVVTNSSATDADSVVLTDPIPSETTYEAGSVMTGTGAACDSSATDTGFGSTSGSPVDTVSASFGTISSGNPVWISFQVKLN